MILLTTNQSQKDLAKVLSVETTTENNERVKLIRTSLSYPVTSCVKCNSRAVVKNGFQRTHLRLASLNRIRYEMKLAKQRYCCSDCQKTFGATTDLTKPNQILSRKLKNQIISFVREGLNGEPIARLCHCSSSSVRRTIIVWQSSPKHLFFDEFRSTKSVMSFICCDSETHQLVVKLHDRLSPSIIDYFENRYSKDERAQVEAVVIELNAQYQSFIYRLFSMPKLLLYDELLNKIILFSCQCFLTKSPTIITTNVPLSSWGTVLHSMAAILDRLVYHPSYIVWHRSALKLP